MATGNPEWKSEVETPKNSFTPDIYRASAPGIHFGRRWNQAAPFLPFPQRWLQGNECNQQ